MSSSNVLNGAAWLNRAKGVLVLAGALALGACEDVVTDPDGIRGTWELTAVNGDPLPAVAFDGETDFGHVVAIATSGSLTLREATYTERVFFDITLDGVPFGTGAPVEVDGDYSVEGQLLTFEPSKTDYPDFTGTVQGGVLTMEEHNPDFGTLTLTWER